MGASGVRCPEMCSFDVLYGYAALCVCACVHGKRNQGIEEGRAGRADGAAEPAATLPAPRHARAHTDTRRARRGAHTPHRTRNTRILLE